MAEFIQFIHDYWGILCVIGASAFSGFILFLESRFAKKSDIADLRLKVEKNAAELQMTKDEMKHMPTKENVIEMMKNIHEVKVDVASMSSSLLAIGHQVNLLLENELEEKHR